MDRIQREQVITAFEQLNYEDKLFVFSRTFSLGNLMTKNFDDKLVLLSLIAFVTKKMREKDSTITPIKILLSITKTTNDGTHFYQFLESLAILSEDFSYECEKISSCGLNSSQEIINKIKELINSWIPF